MFDAHVIVPGSFRDATDTAGTVTGVRFDARIPYYRGLRLSMVGIRVRLDGAEVDPADLWLSVGTRSFTVAEAAVETGTTWEFASPLTVTVVRPGGIATLTADGDVAVDVSVGLRISYLPFPSVTEASAVLAAA